MPSVLFSQDAARARWLRRKTRLWMTAGIAVAVVGFAVWSVCQALYFAVFNGQLPTTHAREHWADRASWGVGLLVLACMAIGRARRYRGQLAAESSPGDALNAAVLYLRPFLLEAARTLPAAFLSWRSHEELTVEALSDFGPVKAIAVPGDRLHRVGAQRIQLSAGEWRRQVRELMASATLVAIDVSASGGVLWEAAQALQLVPPERLVLLVTDRGEYRKFRAQLDVGFPRGLPERIPTVSLTLLPRVIVFDRVWTPEVVQLRRFVRAEGFWRNSFVGALRAALSPVYDRLGHRRPTVRPKVYWIVRDTLFLLALLLPFFVVDSLIGRHLSAIARLLAAINWL